jgi:hypothetical protein
MERVFMSLVLIIFNFELVSLDDTNKTVKVIFGETLWGYVWLKSLVLPSWRFLYVKYVDQPAPEWLV